MLYDLLNFCCSYYCTASWEDTVDCSKLFACTLCIRSHSAFSDDYSYTCEFGKFILEFLHTHGGCRSNRNHFIVIFCSLNLTNDRASVENCFVFDIVWKLSSVLNQTTVCHVTAGHQLSVQPYNVTDFDVSQVFFTDWCNKNFFISSDFDHVFSLRLCVEFPCGMCITGYCKVRIYDQVTAAV